MAKFEIGYIRSGAVGRESRSLSLKRIIFEEGDREIFLPGTFENEPITHFGCDEKYMPEEERWHDWHHPAQGTEILPERYETVFCYVSVPKHVEKIHFPKEMTYIYTCSLENDSHVTYAVDENNPRYCADKNGRICYKK